MRSVKDKPKPRCSFKEELKIIGLNLFLTLFAVRLDFLNFLILNLFQKKDALKKCNFESPRCKF